MPKAEELVATPYRHGSKEKAEAFFLDGMTQAMHRLARAGPPGVSGHHLLRFQAVRDESEAGHAQHWLGDLPRRSDSRGFAISGTWPMRTELGNRMIGNDTNALASSIVLVCRCRPANAATTSRRSFLRELNNVLPEALDEMTRSADSDHSPVTADSGGWRSRIPN